MLDTHDNGSFESWNKYDTKANYSHRADSKGSTVGLIFLIVILMGMGLYIGSFYWDREPVPEITRKHKPSETNQQDYHDYPIAFDKNLG